ncbi:hypothetical protein BDV24DRAFT_143111 [Aspergillus arachidicola]|uniref:Uncharacterized protein n=1 Tax=Aspergillus arachidicola TaxID=656916 RepID=A0A5N6XS31_9EURO|nr:hypothetical protein BDV24DRAFT_143111 [Aspergillus arachidicola]
MILTGTLHLPPGIRSYKFCSALSSSLPGLAHVVSIGRTPIALTFMLICPTISYFLS